MAVTDASPQLRVAAPARPTSRPPVLWWAGIGAVFVILEVYLYTAWFATGEAERPPRGPDHLGASTHFWLWFFTIASCSVAAIAIWHAVRTSRRERRLSFDAMLLIAWVAVWWQDPLLNYVRPTGFFNAYLLTLG